jgi:hypothetical protein
MSTYIKSQLYNGSVITIEARLNAGADYTESDGAGNVIVQEATHDIVVGINNLTTLATITASATGTAITHASLDNLYISYITIAGGSPIYSNALDAAYFSKEVDEQVINLVGTTVTTGDAVVAYYLADGTGDVIPDVRTKNLNDQLIAAETQAKMTIDGVDSRIHAAMTTLGYTYN